MPEILVVSQHRGCIAAPLCSGSYTQKAGEVPAAQGPKEGDLLFQDVWGLPTLQT